jgi:hypothetical protein
MEKWQRIVPNKLNTGEWNMEKINYTKGPKNGD